MRDVSSGAAILLLLYAAFVAGRHIVTVRPPRRHMVFMLVAALGAILSQALVLVDAIDVSQAIRALTTVAFALAVVYASRSAD